MANFYTDNEDIKFHLGHPLMEKIVALKERNYTEAQQYDNAPRDFEDAFDNYDIKYWKLSEKFAGMS